MNYKHVYHAGNFADVLKHCVLISVLQLFSEKNKPFLYLETHAGSGLYPLSFEEHYLGVDKIMALESQDKTIEEYSKWVKESGFPKFYPGSPRIAELSMPSDCRKIFFELQATEALTLKKNILCPKKSIVYSENGYQGLKSQLPPIEKRGVILIDPPYEKDTEYQDILNGLKEALQRFATGVYLVWYPIKEKKTAEDFLKTVTAQISKPLLNVELCLYDFDTAGLGLVGSGMIVINPPWKLQERVEQFLPQLWQCLSPDKKGYYSVN